MKNVTKVKDELEHEVEEMFKAYNPKRLVVSNKKPVGFGYVVLSSNSSVKAFLKDANSGKYSLKMVSQIYQMRQNLKKRPIYIYRPIPRKMSHNTNE